MSFFSKIFKGISKGVKGLVKGVGKAFKGVFKAVGKFAKSKLGRIVIMAVAVVALGAAAGAFAGAGGGAAAAGAGAASGTTTTLAGSFMTKFVAGAKAFAHALVHPVSAAKNLFAGTSAVSGGATVAGTTSAAGTAEAAAAATEGVTAAVAPTAAAAAPAATTAAQTGMLAKAATGLGKFAMSPAGGILIGNAVTGYAQGKAQEAAIEAEREEKERQDQKWSANPAGVQSAVNAASKPFNVSQGYLDRAKRVSDFMNNRPFGSATSPLSSHNVGIGLPDPTAPA